MGITPCNLGIIWRISYMALEDGKLISREDLKSKINELIKLVSDQSDVLTSGNVNAFLDKAIRKYKVWTWRSQGVVINIPYPRIRNATIPSMQVKDHYYRIPQDHILYNVDLSNAALLLRFKSNPNDPVFTALKEFDNLHIEQNGNVYTFKSNGGPAKCYYSYKISFQRHLIIEASADTVIAGEATEYVNVSTGTTNDDILAGGASLQSLLSDSVINEYFTSGNVDLSITNNDVPRPDNIIEDNEMNITFRTLLMIFSKIRMVSFQKQYNNRYHGGYYNVGGPIDSPIYLKNLKKITPININDIFHNFNVDQRLIDNKDVIDKLNEIYEIWKKLPKETIYLRYCHTNCHGSHHTRH